MPVPKALILRVKARCVAGERDLHALVDTGAAVPLVFRKDLFPREYLSKSVCPVKFVTASGNTMMGGLAGLKLQLTFPILVDESTETVICDEMWPYEAELHSTELILGYPLLTGFGLGVDSVHSCLRLSQSDTLRSNMTSLVSSGRTQEYVIQVAPSQEAFVSGKSLQRDQKGKMTVPDLSQRLAETEVFPLSKDEKMLLSPEELCSTEVSDQTCRLVALNGNGLKSGDENEITGQDTCVQQNEWLNLGSPREERYSYNPCSDLNCICNREVVEQIFPSEVWNVEELKVLHQKSTVSENQWNKWIAHPVTCAELKRCLEK